MKKCIKDSKKNNMSLHVIGDISKFSDELQSVIKEAEEVTSVNDGISFQIALNYGARDEITNATKKILASGLKAEDVTPEVISKYLYTADVPDPDILIRTGGEQRISNYLLWQIAYSEIIIKNEHWPEFGKNLLAESIQEFGKRQRRYGK